jgi:hypothetical protein
MTRILHGLGALGVALLTSSMAHAVPTAVGVGAFTSAPIDSNVAADVAITTQLTGMTVSGLVGFNNNNNLFGFGGPLVTGAGQDPVDPESGLSGFLDFPAPIVRFGLVIDATDDTSLQLFRGGSFIGAVVYDTAGFQLESTFIGIEELGGFDRVVIPVLTPGPHGYVADLFRFDVQQTTVVPEPATFVLLVSAVAGFGVARASRRR